MAAALAASSRGGGTPAVRVALPRAADATVVRFVVTARGAHVAAPRVALASRPPKGIAVFAWVGRDASNRRRYDVLALVVNAAGGPARGSVAIALGRGTWKTTTDQLAANVVQPGRKLVCDDVYDIRSAPVALARGTVTAAPLKAFAAACALAADGPAPFDFVRSFGGFYCATSFVNDTAILRGPRWSTSCTKPFASAQLAVAASYDLQGADATGGARCSTSGQTLSCAAASEVEAMDMVLLLRPVPGDSPSGTATIRRSDGEQVAHVDVVQYPGVHQHG